MKNIRLLVSTLVIGVAMSACGGMPVNSKLPMSFGVDSTGRNRFVGEFKDIQLSFGGKTYHSGPAKTGDLVKPFPSAKDAAKGMRFKCRFVTKDAAKSQRLLDNVTPGKGDGFLIDIYKGRFRAAIGGVCYWSHPVPIRTGRETTVEIVVSADDEVTVSVDGDARKVVHDDYVPNWQSVKRVENAAPHPDATWKIRFREPAVWSLKGWQRRSLSFGNGYFGVSEFGGTDVERLQLTEPTFHTQQKHPSSRWVQGNLTDSADLFVEFGHKDATDYVREMDLEDGLVTVKYKADGVDYAREYFTSYPDKVGAMRFTASKKGALSFTLRAQVPFLDAKPPMDRTGKVEATGNEIALSEKSGAYGVKLAGRFRVITDGTVERRDGGALAVANATEATVIYTLATNYRFVPEMFEASKGQGSDRNHDRTPYLGPDPSAEAERRVAAASALGYAALKTRHLDDFRGLVGRSSIDVDFDAADMALATPELRALAGNSVYLQQLYWRLGKFLLASSSRPGTRPGSLQGCWSGPVMTTAWALVHRACCRTRTGEGDAAVRLFGNLMEAKTADTLWSIAHGIHIIDANYAGAALFAELVLQSHELDEKGNFVIDLLPALPSSWAKHGSFRGLCARGGWEVDCEWRDGKPEKVNLRPGPHAGPIPLVRFGGKPLDSTLNVAH